MNEEEEEEEELINYSVAESESIFHLNWLFYLPFLLLFSFVKLLLWMMRRRKRRIPMNRNELVMKVN